MIAKYWWFPLCISCLSLAVLGQLTHSPHGGISELAECFLSADTARNQGPRYRSDASPESQDQDDEARQVERTDPHLFVDWPNPDFVLFVSGRQHGYIEPCGCTGLENQKGGLMRRHQFMKELKQKNWPVVPIDTGNQIRRFGIQPSLKLGKTYEALCQIMNYQAIGFGPDDLKLPATDILQNMLNGQGITNPFVSANVVFLDSNEFTTPYRIIEVAGKRIFVTMVLGDEHLENIRSADLTVSAVTPALNRLVPVIAAEACDASVLVAFTSLENSEAIAKQFPHFDLLVTCGGAGEPTLVPERIQVNDHVTQMIQVGSKGMYVGVVGFFANDSTPIRYQRVPMDDRFQDSDEIIKVFIDYQKQLEGLGLDGLSVKPISHPSGRRFIGSEACYDCHDEEWEIWRHGIDMDEDEIGPHWRATLDLTEPTQRVFVQRHFDPECLSCHVTGWNPQHYYPYLSGYLSLKDELLHGNGCENCHGPGYEHVMAEMGEMSASEQEIELFRRELRVTLDEARESLCVQCHDLDNSPDFHHEGGFDEYWSKVKHGGE